MAAIPINLIISANKNRDDAALLGFIRQRPNPDPNNLTDERWLVEAVRQWLTQQINNGFRQFQKAFCSPTSLCQGRVQAAVAGSPARRRVVAARRC